MLFLFSLFYFLSLKIKNSFKKHELLSPSICTTTQKKKKKSFKIVKVAQSTLFDLDAGIVS